MSLEGAMVPSLHTHGRLFSTMYIIYSSCRRGSIQPQFQVTYASDTPHPHTCSAKRMRRLDCLGVPTSAQPVAGVARALSQLASRSEWTGGHAIARCHLHPTGINHQPAPDFVHPIPLHVCIYIYIYTYVYIRRPLLLKGGGAREGWL